MLAPRANHTATLISGGRVLITGGTSYASADGRYPDSSEAANLPTTAEIYDVATGTFSAAGEMSTGRLGHTATLLADGTVLVAGGVIDLDRLGGKGFDTASAEIYDPATGSFTVVGSMRFERNLHTATLLDDGRVLVTGGSYAGASAELFDPQARTFSSTGSMKSVRSAHTATKLPNGSILVAGGALGGECIEEPVSACQPVASMEAYDPVTGAFEPIGFMSAARWAHTATLLDSGELLFAGGEGESSAELYP